MLVDVRLGDGLERGVDDLVTVPVVLEVDDGLLLGVDEKDAALDGDTDAVRVTEGDVDGVASRRSRRCNIGSVRFVPPSMMEPALRLSSSTAGAYT